HGRCPGARLRAPHPTTQPGPPAPARRVLQTWIPSASSAPDGAWAALHKRATPSSAGASASPVLPVLWKMLPRRLRQDVRYDTSPHVSLLESWALSLCPEIGRAHV